MVEVVEDQVAVSERHAAELSGFSVRRLRAWDARGLVGPSIKRQLSERNHDPSVRLRRPRRVAGRERAGRCGPSAASDPTGR